MVFCAHSKLNQILPHWVWLLSNVQLNIKVKGTITLILYYNNNNNNNNNKNSLWHFLKKIKNNQIITAFRINLFFREMTTNESLIIDDLLSVVETITCSIYCYIFSNV